MIFCLFSSRVSVGKKGRSVPALKSAFDGARPVDTGDGRAGREHQPAGLHVSALEAAFRLSERGLWVAGWA